MIHTPFPVVTLIKQFIKPLLYGIKIVLELVTNLRGIRHFSQDFTQYIPTYVKFSTSGHIFHVVYTSCL